MHQSLLKNFKFNQSLVSIKNKLDNETSIFLSSGKTKMLYCFLYSTENNSLS